MSRTIAMALVLSGLCCGSSAAAEWATEGFETGSDGYSSAGNPWTNGYADTQDLDRYSRSNDDSSELTMLPSAALSDAIETVSYAQAAESALPADLAAEMKKLAWTVGDFKVVPYGFFWADMIYQSERTNPGSFTLSVFSRETHGEPAFIIDSRRSRFGINVAGPNIPLLGGATSGGRLEIDFQGAFVTQNRAAVLLRHAYWEMKNSQYRALIGQTWDVISPLMPGTLNYSVGWFGGNIGFRRTQFRLERYLNWSSELMSTFQVSLNQDIVPDFIADPGVRGEPSDWPVIQGRMALTVGPRGKGCDPITLGLSGHVGETGFDFLVPGPPPLDFPPERNTRFDSWSVNADMRIPMRDWWGFQGEIHRGANLSAFLGGIGQGVCPCLRVPINDTAGWCEVWYDWTPRLHSHFGFGVDDPDNRDSLVGRTYNQMLYANCVVDITSKLSTGLEVAFWKTLYHDTRVGQIDPGLLTPMERGESTVVQWNVKYGF